jgi:hypothetical protein
MNIELSYVRLGRHFQDSSAKAYERCTVTKGCANPAFLVITTLNVYGDYTGICLPDCKLLYSQFEAIHKLWFDFKNK